MALLIREDEDDVQASPAALRGRSLPFPRFRSRSRRAEERRRQGAGGQAMELTPREVALARFVAHFEFLLLKTTFWRQHEQGREVPNSGTKLAGAMSVCGGTR